MPNYQLIRFHFKAPLHISNARADYGISERVVHSDTLYAAIMQVWAIMGKSEWIPKQEDEELGFTLSSMFPFYGGESTPVYFFPKPYLKRKREETQDTSLAKKVKKVQYLEAGRWCEYLNDNASEINEDVLKGAYLTDKKIQKDFIDSDVVPRINKPRNETDPDIFYTERIYFKYNSGLFCLVQFDDETIKQRVLLALDYLQDQGIGTDRAVGNGIFDCQFDNLNLDLTAKSNYGLILSLYCPKDQSELKTALDEHARYELIKRGGWLSEPYNTYRKRSVYMFKEGSVFRRDTMQGKMVDLRPDIIKDKHPVWRVGKVMVIPVKI